MPLKRRGGWARLSRNVDDKQNIVLFREGLWFYRALGGRLISDMTREKWTVD